jgi:hypothetical protein
VRSGPAAPLPPIEFLSWISSFRRGPSSIFGHTLRALQLEMT